MMDEDDRRAVLDSALSQYDKRQTEGALKVAEGEARRRHQHQVLGVFFALAVLALAAATIEFWGTLYGKIFFSFIWWTMIIGFCRYLKLMHRR